MTDEETARVTQVWPKSLKEQVQAHAGPRGLTEFCIAAVQQHLGVAPTFDETQIELNQARALVQTLADKLVLGGDSADRLQSLLEVDFPEWIETVGWPVAFADLVHARRAGESKRVEAPQPEAPEPVEREPAQPQAPEGAVMIDESKVVRVTSAERRAAKGEVPSEAPAPLDVEVSEPTPVASPAETPVETPAVETGPRTDLLAKVMQATGQDLPVPLVAASSLPTPAPKPEHHNHAWERVDGILCCDSDCGAWIDDSDPAYPNGIVREAGWGRSAQEAAADPAKPMCPKGHGELIDGECWTCS